MPNISKTLPGSLGNRRVSFAKPSSDPSKRDSKAFRSLSHEHSFRKKSRTEAAPDPNKLKLLKPSDLTVEDPGLSQKLPVRAQTRYSDPDSLFIPEDETSEAEDTDVERIPSNLQPAGDVRKLHLRRDDPSVCALDTHPRPIESRHLPSTVTSRSPDRGWNKSHATRQSNGGCQGDIACLLTIDKETTIGDVRFTNIAWTPYGQHLIKLGHENMSHVNLLAANTCKRCEFDSHYLLQGVRFEVTGNIEPLNGASEKLKSFIAHLELHDVGIPWVHDIVPFGLLVYSCKALSWTDIGQSRPREGQPRLQVTVLNLPASIERLGKQPLVSGSPGTLERGTLESSNTGPRHELETNEALKARPEASGQIVVGPCQAEVDSPKAMGGDAYVAQPNRAPRTTSGNFTRTRPHSTNKAQLQAILDTPDVVDLKLKYDELIRSIPSNRKVSTATPRFYIAFSRSFPLEAKVIAKWLKDHTASRHVFLDNEIGSWDSFKMQTSTNVAVILFHPQDMHHWKLECFGELLFLDHVSCCTLALGKSVIGQPVPVDQEHIFTRGTIFLITESNILYETDNTLFLLYYFREKRKPTWKIVFRPRIRTWLRDFALRQKDHGKKDALLDILHAICMLMPDYDSRSEDEMMSSDDEQSSDKPESLFGETESPHNQHVISVSSIPRYNDDRDDEAAIRERDDILVDFFGGYTMVNTAIRHAMIFCKEKEPAHKENHHHVYFYNTDTFVQRHQDQISI